MSEDGAPPAAPREVITVSSERVTGFRALTTQVGVFRDAAILDVPLTIEVVPRTVMDVQEAQGLFDALKNTAGVTRSQTNGALADNLSIRGVATENRTSFRLNGGLPVNNLVDIPMEDKERVEVLKGSSALYYGFTSPAGVVNLVTKRARPEPITSFTVSGNDFGQFSGHLDVGRTFGDEQQFGVRANVAAGQVRNAIDGFTGERNFGAVALDWRVSRALSLKIDLEDVRRSGIEQATVGLDAPVNNVITLPHLPDPTRLVSGPWAGTRGTMENWQARVDYDLSPDWSVMAEGGRADTRRDYRRSSQFLNYDVASGEGTLRVTLTRDQAYINKAARSELTGHFFTSTLEHELTLGAMENRRHQSNPSQQAVNLPQNLYDPVELPGPLLTAPITFTPQDITDKGVYVFDRVRIGEQWQVQAGVRRTDYRDQFAGGTYAVNSNTPAYALLWKPRTDTSVYASRIEGLEEGGTAPLITNNGGQVLPPGVTRQNELGVRSAGVAGLLLSAAFFTMDRASAYTNAANFFVLDGRTKYKGLEYSAIGEVGRQVSIYLTGMLLHAEQANAQNAALIGKTPDNTPEQAHSVFVDYRPSAWPGFGVNAGAYYIGKRFINNFEQGAIPGYTLFTLGARYSTSHLIGARTTVQVYVENALDKRYWSAAGGGILSVGLPRTVKMSLRMDF